MGVATSLVLAAASDGTATLARNTVVRWRRGQSSPSADNGGLMPVGFGSPGVKMTPPIEPRGELKVVMLDGEPTWKLWCPGCGHWGIIDDDQAHGRVSVNHGPSGEQGIYEGNACGCGCTFHETRDWVETAVMVNA